MSKELKPFINIVGRLYLQGYTKYPLCKHEQEEVDAKDVANYFATRIMHIQTCSRS
jgi:hypothetical protein